MVKAKNIVAVVVLYNPKEWVLENMGAYHSLLENVVIVDNSELSNKELLDKITNMFQVHIIVNNENKGIATALNQGIEKAIHLGAQWILTMDQDSYFKEDMLKDYLNLLHSMNNKKGIAALGPNYEKKLYTEEISNVDTLITSGTLLSGNVFKQLKGFKVELFIDEVDNDFCYRAKLKGYNLYRCNKIFMNHSLGDEQIVTTIFGTQKKRNFHSPIRLYYIVRNSLYMSLMYKTSFPNSIKKTKKDVLVRIKNNLLYGNQRWSTFKFVILGFMDFKRGKFGKY